MPTKETKPRKKPTASSANRNVIIAIIIILVAVVVISVVIGTRTVSNNSSSTVSVEMPLITTKMTRPSTGEAINVQTLFTVVLDKNARREVEDSLLEQELTSIMYEMDIEKILGEGKVEYINNRATEALTERLAEKGINPRVVLVDLATDDRVTLSDPDNPSSDIMNGLFQNME